MGYNALQQHDHDHDHDEDDGDHDDSPSPNPQQHTLASPVFTPPLSASLFLDDPNTSNEPSYPHTNALGLNYLVQSIASRSTRTDASYDMVESEDFAADARSSPALSTEKPPGTGRSPPSESSVVALHIPRARRRRSPATAAHQQSTTISPRIPSQPIPRTASGRSIALRHPTPDLQVLQGAYTGNILHLEKTAEQLSMTSSMDDAIRELHEEQKRSDSRRSSLLSSQGMSAISRQVSNASSIVEVNSAARSGGFAPAGFMMSPKGSFTAAAGGRGRSASKSSRYGSRPEPELEGRPLDSFVNMHSMSSIAPPSPVLSRSVSIAEQDEDAATMTKPIADLLESPEMNETPRGSDEKKSEEEDRPATSASISTFDQAQKMFADFDGIHSGPSPEEQMDTVDMSREMGDSPKNDNHQRRPSGGRVLSGGRPQSYADPRTGQEMVYYPAPVPMMLNLPQKLSKAPSSMARNKRRSQVMSNIPAAARQSAIWLPDVLENEEDGEMPEDDESQQQEYIPQHQRASMGGRRLTQDLSHMPAHLRASTFFDLPAATQVVELKEQSAVATLDSILDASAHAPVSAFTDHAFAGALGAEVYGKERTHNRNSRSTTQLLEPEQHKKRTSSFNLLLRGRRASSSDLLDTDKRRSTMSGVIEATVRSPIEEDGDEELENGDDFAVKAVEEEEEEEDEGQLDDDVYHGAPTTLLAELQLRKQQQKQRTQHLTKQFPTGIHSTLLEMDAVAQVQQKSRKKKRTILAWEDPNMADQDDEDGDDEDVPLAMLYAKKSAQLRDANRPLGLMERRDMEDNEPLSRRKDRLQGRPPAAPRASTMMNLSGPFIPEEEEGETLAQRVRRLKEQGGTTTGLPSARPVSGDFTSELMSQFGGDLLDPKEKGKGKEPSTSPAPEEEETLGQRRKRLQAEREARAKEVGTQGPPPPYAEEVPSTHNKRRSMADILQAHPAAGAERVVNYQKPVGGLLGLHEKKSSQRASTMLDFPPTAAAEFIKSHPPNRQSSGGFKAGMYNDGKGGIIPPSQIPQQQQYTFPQPSLGAFHGFNTFQNPYASNMNLAAQNSSYNLGAMPSPLPLQMSYMPGMPMVQGMNMNMNMGMGMSMLQMGQGVQPLKQGQIDMVERWRQSVMQ
ncbi:uncharacterized protein LY89DRAFT_670915 [Mollisia scopiformis]|uniref:Uncharacterized protein n=1 Tax=Mollisia scopiformis TaxID=149040 RepID=A0A194X5K0_MOLSC|nr:uncharacterized protein LY89DRAFT_670915 [Mollisia scopiformis]KUJ15445.1 hypothetical protein LY89DRAFT_670915 [Mollisia scopiformis]